MMKTRSSFVGKGENSWRAVGLLSPLLEVIVFYCCFSVIRSCPIFCEVIWMAKREGLRGAGVICQGRGAGRRGGAGHRFSRQCWVSWAGRLRGGWGEVGGNQTQTATSSVALPWPHAAASSCSEGNGWLSQTQNLRHHRFTREPAACGHSGEGEGEMNWRVALTYTVPCVKKRASGRLLDNTGSSAWCSVICDDLEG